MNSAKVRLLIVEDHALMAEGICHWLRPLSYLQVLGVVADGLAVYEQCLRLTPDLLLLDLGLPGMDGLDVMLNLRRRWPTLRMVVYSACRDVQRLRQCLAAGAAGYVLKQSPPAALLSALAEASAGRQYVDPAFSGMAPRPGQGVQASDLALTPRERQILKLIAEGQRNRDIARLLLLSIKTVETHRLNLMRKLDAHNAAALSSWAHRLGLVAS